MPNTDSEGLDLDDRDKGGLIGGGSQDGDMPETGGPPHGSMAGCGGRADRRRPGR